MREKLAVLCIAALGYATIIAATVVRLRIGCAYDIFWWIKR